MPSAVPCPRHPGSFGDASVDILAVFILGCPSPHWFVQTVLSAVLCERGVTDRPVAEPVFLLLVSREASTGFEFR